MPQGPIPPRPTPLFRLRTGPGFSARAPRPASQSPVTGAQFTEFYTQSGGSNLNAGTDTNNSASYTTASGNWNGTTTFTVTDGTIPSLNVKIGDYVSIYADGSTSTGFIARVTAAQGIANGTITVSASARAGSQPASGTGTRTLKAGGAWQGPQGSDLVPFSFNTLGSAVNLAGNRVRVNMKNDASYLISSAINAALTSCTIQGYTNNPGDGGRAVIDTSTNAVGFSASSSQNAFFIDLEIKTSAASGTGTLFRITLATAIRCVIHGARGIGLDLGQTGSAIECEIYNCNTSNTAGLGGISVASATNAYSIKNCYIHDNFVAGLVLGAATNMQLYLQNTIFESNPIAILIASSTGAGAYIFINECDFYNHSGNVIQSDNTALTPTTSLIITNSNFFKAGGARIRLNAQGAPSTGGFIYNCGQGGGIYAMSVADSSLGGIYEFNRRSYPVDTTPWVDPDNGDFRITNPLALSGGRGFFTETDSGLSAPNTVGYPDIGAAQAPSRSPSWQDETVILPDAFVNHSYVVDWTFANNTSLSLISGGLPNGLSLIPISSAESQITGTPTGTIGVTYTFVLRATIDSGITQDSTFSITVQDDPDQGSAFAGGF